MQTAITEFSPDQTKALDSIGAWLKDPSKQVFTLHGFAGTGKTSLAQHVAAQHDGITQFAAYTGKAADVLRQKGCPATTIHRLIYLPNKDRDEEISATRGQLMTLKGDDSKAQKERRRLKHRIEELLDPSWCLRSDIQPTDKHLLILDEVSMLNEQVGEDLKKFPWKILTLGDPGQLPPIEGAGYFDKHPDYTLTEIHRQAKESPILQLATLARERKPLRFGKYGNCEVINRKKIDPEYVFGVEQCVVGSNKARKELNTEYRFLKHFDKPHPMKGERLICLRNNNKTNMLNGQVVTVHDYFDNRDPPQLWFKEDGADPRDDAGVKMVYVHKECFANPEDLRIMDWRERAAYDEFDWAYAITGHKSQGSQFSSVLVYADMFRWDRDMFARWLYTAITRSIDRVVVAI